MAGEHDRSEWRPARFDRLGEADPGFDSKPANQQTASMKMTLDLPPDLIRAMKLRAVNEHRKLKEVAAELLARGLGTEATKAGPAKGSIALPLFPTSPDAPATGMTTEQLLALEQATLHQEDLRRLGHAL
jgi:hypothetical protein